MDPVMLGVALMVLVFGSVIYSYWSIIASSSGSYWNRFKSWFIGLFGGTAATVTAVYARWMEMYWTPSVNLVTGWLSGDLGTLYEWTALFVLVGAISLPLLVILANTAIYGQPVLEGATEAQMRKEERKLFSSERFMEKSRNPNYTQRFWGSRGGD